jgi:hypothetical protein
MIPLTPPLTAFGSFVIALLALAWLSRVISIHVQLLVLLLTRSTYAATLALFLLLFPGVVVHEGAHWLAAKALGLRPSRFRVWPRPRGKTIGMGSVTVRSGGPLLDSIVGMAPLIAGSIVIALIAHRIFHAYDITARLAEGEWIGVMLSLRNALREPDAAIWAYLLFAVANAMMPSASDREPLKPVLLYAGLTILFYLLLRFPLGPVLTTVEFITPYIEELASAFLLVILLDLAIAALLGLLRLLTGR